MADCEGRLSPNYLEDLEDEALDPRIQGELERLNKASEEINKLELELDDRRATFRQALSDSTHKLNTLAKKLGTCVEKARPYYDARHKAKEAHIETQKVAIRYERACSMHEAAKEMVQLAEQGYMCREEPSDPAWQEMLNHATMKVNEAEKERNESEKEHMRTTLAFKEAEERVQHIQKDLKRAISKSKPYYEMKVKFNQMMEDQKRSISMLEEDVSSAKTMYSEALRNLETISDEIHQQRVDRRKNQELGVRGAGVGSESPSPPPSREQSEEGHDSAYSNSYQKSRDSYLSLPSVIYPSPEKARNQSYRDAIDNRSEDQNSLSEIDEIPEFTWEEEYMHLPNTYSPRGKIVRGVQRTNLSESESDKTLLASSPRDGYLSSSPRDTVHSNKPSSLSSSPRNESQNFHTEELHVAQESETQSASASSKEGTPASGSPARGRKKLQGLILQIDPTMDPLSQSYQTKTMLPTRTGQKSSQNRPYSTPDILPGQHDVPYRWKSNRGHELPIQSPGRKISPGHPGTDRSLSVPCGTEHEIVDNSDTESIASTGPMLDDDQVEFLTLEFSENMSANDFVSPVAERHNWNRMSLPPTLTNIDEFLRSRESEKKITKETITKDIETKEPEPETEDKPSEDTHL